MAELLNYGNYNHETGSLGDCQELRSQNEHRMILGCSMGQIHPYKQGRGEPPEYRRRS
jgi:hypothetical protein